MRTFAIIVASAVVSTAGADTITQWNFNGESAATVPGGPTSPSTSFGTGSASLFGGTTGTFASGIVDGGSSDPIITSPTNFAWNITTFAAQGTGDMTRGVQFMASTEGFETISVMWDQRNSNTASRWVQFLYTTDGTNFVSTGLADGGVFDISAGVTWFNGLTAMLGSIAGVADNANFGFRLVSTFGPSGAYEASGSGSAYGTSGTWRLDMVTVSGTLIPTPGAMALLGLAALVTRRRR